MSKPKDQPAELTLRLHSPSIAIGLVILLLSTLPMASCSAARPPAQATNSRTRLANTSDGLVPASLVLDAIVSPQDETPAFQLTYLSACLSCLGTAYAIAIPYAIGLICFVPCLLIWRSHRWATRIWRVLILMHCVGCTYVMFAGSWLGLIGVIATVLWLSSSTLAQWVRRPSAESGRLNPVTGGYWCVAILALAGYLYLLSLKEVILYGGVLAMAKGRKRSGAELAQTLH